MRIYLGDWQPDAVGILLMARVTMVRITHREPKEMSAKRRLLMKRNRIVLGLVAILVITALLFGCGGAETTPTPTPTPTPTLIPTPTGKTLSEMLGMSSEIVSIKYDMLITGPGIPTITTKMWLKKNKMRTEVNQQGVNAVTLIDADAKTMYTYMLAQNMAIKMPSTQVKCLKPLRMRPSLS